MKRIMISTLVMSSLVLAAAARAQEPPSGAAMEMPKAGAEIKAIKPIFGVSSATWKGKVEPGAMGPGSPATTSKGKVTCRSLLGGLWYACDVENSYAGKPPMTWKGHMAVGYDVTTKSYKASVVDNLGTLTTFDGSLEGTKFMLVTPSAVMMNGQMMKDRLSWDMADPKAIRFTDEHQLEGGEWTLFESATMVPVMKSAKPVASGTGVHVSK